MPSPYSSPETQADARLLAQHLGVEQLELDDRAGDGAPTRRRSPSRFAGREPGIAEENLQARIRGNLLMALSNKFGWLVLATGNKSEMSVGYSTLYGDTGGRLRGHQGLPEDAASTSSRATSTSRRPRADRRPRSSSTAPPSAELRHDQRDEDSLPPYAILDPILDGYVEQDLGREQLIARGFDAADVDRVIALVDRAEYKRRQAPPGIKITPRAFGRDRRLPITNRYGDEWSFAVAIRQQTTTHHSRGARTAIVMRVVAHRRPSSSVTSTSHSHVVRPRCSGRASAWIVPDRIGRRKLVLFESPIACIPCSWTPTNVPIEASVSAIAAKTPPCTSPNGCSSSGRTGTLAVSTPPSFCARSWRPMSAAKPWSGRGRSLMARNDSAKVYAWRR